MKKRKPTPSSHGSKKTLPDTPKSGAEAPLMGRAERVFHEIEAILQEIFEKKKVSPHNLRNTRLVLEAVLDPGRNARHSSEASSRARDFARRLIDRIHHLAQEQQFADAPFPPGRLRCFWCSSFNCSHSRPPEPRSVFNGYSPTGEPQWIEFGVLAQETHHPRVDNIYRDSASPITLIQSGSELTRERLSVYANNTHQYRILGQVVVGYLMRRSRNDSDSREKLAMTLQAVETRHGGYRYHLNVLGQLPDGQALSASVEEVLDERFLDAIAAARGKLEEIALLRLNAKRNEKEETTKDTRKKRRRKTPPLALRERRAMNVLRRLAQNIDRIHRQGSRRTQHARDRHRDRERPASSALRDALKATAESIYRDSQEHTWVVIGPRRRVHIFNDLGQHVTSVVYPAETIQKRTTHGKWKAAQPGELEGFRKRLELLGDPGEP